MDEDSLGRIANNLDIAREKICVLYKNPDRPNIYLQLRRLKQPIDVM